MRVFTVALVASSHLAEGASRYRVSIPSSLVLVPIVFVDDDALVLASITELLTHLGLTVRAFSNGPEALGSIESELPDAVLIDLNMPGMDGFEVAAAIRERVSRKLRLVAFTGVSSKGQRSAAALAGFDVFLTKTCPGAAIVRALQGDYE